MRLNDIASSAPITYAAKRKLKNKIIRIVNAVSHLFNADNDKVGAQRYCDLGMSILAQRSRAVAWEFTLMKFIDHQ